MYSKRGNTSNTLYTMLQLVNNKPSISIISSQYIYSYPPIYLYPSLNIISILHSIPYFILHFILHMIAGQAGPTGSVVSSRPDFPLTRGGCCSPIQPYYNPIDVYNAWVHLIQAGTNNQNKVCYHRIE